MTEGSIRLAEYKDRPHFLRLWRELLRDQYDQGSHIQDSDHNLYLMRELFDAYTQGTLDGFCLLWEDEGGSPGGIIMFGESAVLSELDTDWGKSGILWGVYVDPEHRGKGIGLALEFAALPWGIKHGFDTVETTVLTSNPHGERMASGFGTKPFRVLSWADLRQVEARLKETMDG